MAEFCKECFEKDLGYFVKDDEKIEISEDLDLCEGCGEIKPVVLKIRNKRFYEK